MNHARSRIALSLASILAALALGGVLGFSLQPPATAPRPMTEPAAASPTLLPERFIPAETLNALALSLPKPPADIAQFDREVAHFLRDHAADWPRAAERAKATAPKDEYSKHGFDYLVLIDDKLAADVNAAATPAARAAACRARCPATCAILERATRDLVTSKYKPFERPRPIGDHRDSYPSGHAAQAILQCRLLWEIVRDKHPGAEDVLPNEAYARAIDRVMIAIHHPTDIAAGLAFGLATARLILEADTPEFHKTLEAARQEW